MKLYGKQEFRQYPLVTMEELPSNRDLGDHYRRAVQGQLGVRMKDLDRPLVCRQTAKSYKFWDNLMYHYKHLAPLYGHKVEFRQYTSPHDGWLYNESSNLKLHNKVCKFEQAQATEIEHRVNIDNPEWVHPCNRNDERYYDPDPEEVWRVGAKKDVKRSRFLKKEHKVELSYKDQQKNNVSNVLASLTQSGKKKQVKKESEEEIKEEETDKKPAEKNRHGVTVVDWPHDPEDLEPIRRPPPKHIPDYYGWTHSDNADSWYLEAHTPSIHESYEDFYGDALRKRVICPKFYSCV